MDATLITIIGNVVAISGGLWLIADRFRRWIDKKVAEPVSRIETKVDQQAHEIKRVRARAEEAHKRLDRFHLNRR